MVSAISSRPMSAFPIGDHSHRPSFVVDDGNAAAVGPPASPSPPRRTRRPPPRARSPRPPSRALRRTRERSPRTGPPGELELGWSPLGKSLQDTPHLASISTNHKDRASPDWLVVGSVSSLI